MYLFAPRFVIDQNINRRHLGTAQRALIAAGMANAQVGDLGNGRRSANLQTYSADQAAALLNVSTRTAMDAKRILASGRQDIIDLVRAGELSVNGAVKLH